MRWTRFGCDKNDYLPEAALTLLKLASMLVRLDHVARIIGNANHSRPNGSTSEIRSTPR